MKKDMPHREDQGKALQRWATEIDELKIAEAQTANEPRGGERRLKLVGLRARTEAARENLMRVFLSIKGKKTSK